LCAWDLIHHCSPLICLGCPGNIFAPSQHSVTSQEEKQAEEDRQAKLRAAYVAAIPDEIKEEVEAAVSKEVAAMREEIISEYHDKTEELRAQIQAMRN
jgi:hypothetical protein